MFICHGNICRSAAAEMVIRQMLRERGIQDIAAESAAASRRKSETISIPW